MQLSAAASRSDITLCAYDDVEEIATVWRAFQQRADLTVFQSYDWLANWQRHIGRARGAVPAIVIGFEADGDILFILQLAIYTTRPVRRLRWLGSQLCDYNAPLLARDYSARMSPERFRLAWRDSIELLRLDSLFHFDVIDLAKMPEWIGEQRNPFIDLRVSVHPSGAYLATLGRDWHAFYESKRSGATRKRERRQLRHLADHSEVRFVNVEGADEIERTLRVLFEQKSEAFARMGVEDAFLRPGEREFFLAVAKDSAVSDLVHVSRLDVGNQMAAISIGLQHCGCYHLILSSYASGALSRFGRVERNSVSSCSMPSSRGLCSSISPSERSPTNATGAIRSAPCTTIWPQSRCEAGCLSRSLRCSAGSSAASNGLPPCGASSAERERSPACSTRGDVRLHVAVRNLTSTIKCTRTRDDLPSAAGCAKSPYTSLRNERPTSPSWPGLAWQSRLATRKDVDARDKRGHDESNITQLGITRRRKLVPRSGDFAHAAGLPTDFGE